MIIAEQTAAAAFKARRQAYAKWKLKEHLRVFKDASDALSKCGTEEHFRVFWNDLVAWRAFRNSECVMLWSDVRSLILELRPKVQELKLSSIGQKDEAILNAVTMKLEPVKRDSEGILRWWRFQRFFIF